MIGARFAAGACRGRARRSAGAALAAVLLHSCAAFAVPAKPDIGAVLTAALRGPRAPFSGVQRSEIASGAGRVVSSVKVTADGKGRIRHDYRDGPAAGVVLLKCGRTLFQKAPGWSRLPDAVEPDAAAVAARIRSGYSVTVGAPEVLLGRRVLPIRIVPKQPFDPSRRIWLDPGSRLILKDILYAPDGRLRSSTAYVTLSFGPQSSRLLTPPVSASSPLLRGPGSFRPVASAADARRETGYEPPIPAHIPAGYAVEAYGVMTAGSGRRLPAVRYSNGISAFTIYRRGEGHGHGMGAGRPRGGMHGLTSDVQHSVTEAATSAANYLLIGDLAASELQRIANSLP